MQDQPAAIDLRKSRNSKMQKHQLRIDMTPMVDLGFLLISFFIFTTEISRPHVTDLFMPANGDSSAVAESKTITILMGEGNRLYYYNGKETTAFVNHGIIPTNYSVYQGIGEILRARQNNLDLMKLGRRELIVLIKPGKAASYHHLVNILDEMLINGVTRYAIADPSSREEKYLAQGQF
jgi:biopolymer transport protein ExbD